MLTNKYMYNHFSASAVSLPENLHFNSYTTTVVAPEHPQKKADSHGKTANLDWNLASFIQLHCGLWELLANLHLKLETQSKACSKSNTGVRLGDIKLSFMFTDSFYPLHLNR